MDPCTDDPLFRMFKINCTASFVIQPHTFFEHVSLSLLCKEKPVMKSVNKDVQKDQRKKSYGLPLRNID